MTKKQHSSKKATKATARTKGVWQGMNWIRPAKRLAIYMRDGLACCYCGACVEDNTSLSLDHLVPHSKGGSNHESNLVTCCERCNKSRGTRPVAAFIKAVAAYVNHGVKAEDIAKHIRNCSARSLKPHMSEAKALMARRGNFSAALASATLS